jgi:eukaryotic-like serine/threonine-protein kinase
MAESSFRIGHTVLHYRIIEKVGAGGMGEVYRATDSKLGRDVALKVLPADMARDPDRLVRFQREARAVAALNHPHIVTIYSVEEADGVHFLTMELVRGQSLDRSIPAGGLPAERVVEIADALADALAAAHEQGIVHRDLKPANVMVTESGRVKVLDFGLAKDVSAETANGATLTSAGYTSAGVVLGTPAYMSPEQAEGRIADARSDIFSFGTVLYEMLSGRRPFSGGSAAAVIGAIVHKAPEPLNAPPALDAIVQKCLAKSPDGRFQSATDLRRALQESSTVREPAIKPRIHAWVIAISLLVLGFVAVGIYLKGTKTGRIDSIAVLPLEIRSNDSEAEYISDGITESINNSLAQLPNLKVIPRSVALHYKGQTVDLRKLGKELGVQAVLTGRVGQRGDELTVGVELDDVRDGKQLWGQQYNRKVADLLAIQNDIAREVSQRLRSQLSAADQKKLMRGSTENPEAYQLYLKGKFYTNKFTKDGFSKGIDYFSQAIAIDPNYGLAYTGLAYNYLNQDDWYIRPHEAGPKAREAAEKALAIDDSDAEAHVSLAIEKQWYEWDWAASEREFKRAIELSPNNSEAHAYYSWYLAPMGRKAEALAEAKLAVQTDPFSPLSNFIVGSVMVFAHQWDPAIEQLRSAKELDATYWFNSLFLARAYEQKGKFPEAIAEFKSALELDNDNTETWSGLGHAYAVSGNRAETHKVLDHLKELSTHSYVCPYSFAVIYAGMKENDQAFAWLERAFSERSYFMAVYLPTDARLDNLRSDPRFAALLRRVGLPE